MDKRIGGCGGALLLRRECADRAQAGAGEGRSDGQAAAGSLGGVDFGDRAVRAAADEADPAACNDRSEAEQPLDGMGRLAVAPAFAGGQRCESVAEAQERQEGRDAAAEHGAGEEAPVARHPGTGKAGLRQAAEVRSVPVDVGFDRQEEIRRPGHQQVGTAGEALRKPSDCGGRCQRAEEDVAPPPRRNIVAALGVELPEHVVAALGQNREHGKEGRHVEAGFAGGDPFRRDALPLQRLRSRGGRGRAGEEDRHVGGRRADARDQVEGDVLVIEMEDQRALHGSSPSRREIICCR